MFDPSRHLLTKLNKIQIGWWNKCHIEQQGGKEEGGKVGNQIVQYSFKQEKNGQLSKGGKYNTALLTKTSFKYPEQGHFSFGVAKVKRLVWGSENEGN